MSRPSRVALVVDDDRLFASLVATTLESSGFLCHVANDVAQAVKLLRSIDPDVAVIDVHLGDGPSGIHFGQMVSHKYPGIGIVFLTRSPDLSSAGFNPHDLPARCAVTGKEFLDDADSLLDAIDSVVLSTRDPIRHDQDHRSPLAALTAHQMTILTSVAAGLTNQAIAVASNTSERSVERTLANIYSRLGIEHDNTINPRVEATRIFTRWMGSPRR